MNSQNDMSPAQQNRASTEQRRRFLKGAIATAPTLMVLANRPAFGAACSISGFTSVNPSQDLSGASTCEAWSPGAWKEAWEGQSNHSNSGGELAKDLNGWGVAGCDGDAHSFDFFFQGPIQLVKEEDIQDLYHTSSYNSSLYQVLSSHGRNSSVPKHATAALLNARFIKNWDGELLPWMEGYPDPADVVGIYLVYDAWYVDTYAKDVDRCQYTTTTGVIVRAPEWTKDDFEQFFVTMAGHDV